MALSNDLWKVAQDAIADVGNTYRAVLLQHTGWIAPRPGEQGFDPEMGEASHGVSLFGRLSTLEIATKGFDRIMPVAKIEMDI